MIIRRAQPDDAAAVGAITRDVYVGGGYADPDQAPGYVASLADGAGRIAEAVVFVAESVGRIVGTVSAATPGSAFSNTARAGELEVRMLAVLPDDRRGGIASALMTACEDLAVDLGCHAVVLSTDPAMRAARQLYEHRGFIRTPERDWSVDGVDLLTFRLDPPHS